MFTFSTSDLNLRKRLKTLVFLHCWLGNAFRATTACTFLASQLPKVVRSWCALYILTWKCVSRHNSVHFFWHLNFQKWSDHGVLCTFWLGNVLRAATACTFLASQLPKVVRSSGAVCILTSKCASRHNGAQFLISYLASWLRTRRFSEPTFRPSWATNHWKNTMNRDFPTFSPTFSDLLTSFLLLSDSSHLWTFPTVHIVGSFTSKLPSINLFPCLSNPIMI